MIRLLRKKWVFYLSLIKHRRYKSTRWKLLRPNICKNLITLKLRNYLRNNCQEIDFQRQSSELLLTATSETQISVLSIQLHRPHHVSQHNIKECWTSRKISIQVLLIMLYRIIVLLSLLFQVSEAILLLQSLSPIKWRHSWVNTCCFENNGICHLVAFLKYFLLL